MGASGTKRAADKQVAQRLRHVCSISLLSRGSLGNRSKSVRVLRLLLLTIPLVLTGCATGNTEYRAGLVLHQNPDFSFHIPPGWRPAKASDWTSFGANQRPLQKLNDYGKAEFQRMGAAELAR